MFFCYLGDKSIPKSNFKFIAILATPLLLGGCGLPVGVSVASLIADGISFAATEKTLTDHGLSLVTNKDCAIWRGIKGEDICADSDDLSGDIMVAELPDQSPASEEKAELENSSLPVASVEEETEVRPEEIFLEDTKLANLDLGVELTSALSRQEIDPPVTLLTMEEEVFDTPTEMEKALRVSEKSELAAVEPAQAVKEWSNPDQGGTYYVIASYYRATDAERFASKQTKLKTQVLSGTAKGKSVYRVAVGPVTDRQSTKQHLLDSGYHDTWALKQMNPTVITEIASLE